MEYTAKMVLKEPSLVLRWILEKFFKWMPDRAYLNIEYLVRMKKRLNLDNPVTFNEKTQWLKLNDRNPLYTSLSDKYEVRGFVAGTIGAEHLVPLLGVWDRFEDIDFGSLPDRFVLKCTHDSGGHVICKGKAGFDIKAAKRRINSRLRRNFYYKSREWTYKGIRPRIVAEENIDTTGEGVLDYKFFCFNAEAKLMYIASERQSAEETKFDFFDMDFNHLPFTNGHPNSEKELKPPLMFDEMKRLASLLSAGIPYVRVDFYEVDGHVYFGEMTFFHLAGMVPFVPEEWDYKIGEWLELEAIPIRCAADAKMGQAREKARMAIKEPSLVLRWILEKCFKWMPDRTYLKIEYLIRMKKRLNLDNPVTFNEKIQWLKLNDRNPLHIDLSDKYAVRSFVAGTIGAEYLVPLLGVWDRFEDIDFSSLPDRFVLKCTHDSGGVVICKGKADFDIKAARRSINSRIRRNFYYKSREWPYRDIKPRIIVEENIDSAGFGIPDYKFFCFGGEAKLMFIATERQSAEETKFDFFDMDFNHLPFTNGHPNSKKELKPPLMFDEMKRLASLLSAGIAHVRVDFYEVDGRVYFGEMTFFHWSGMVPFVPDEWDYIIGDMLELAPES